MAIGGSVLIEMGINSARMAGDLGKITSMMQSGARKITSVFQGIGATVVGAIGVGSLGMMAKAAIETAHDVELMGQKFGIATSTLSEYMVTAKIAGVDMEGVGKGLKFLAKNATDAATGVGKNAEVFKKMGIEVKDSVGNLKPMAVLLDEVRGKFQGYAQGTEMAALALKLFGREGVSMIPWLVMSKEKLEELEKVGKAFGATMDEDGIRVTAELADKMHLLEFAGKGLANQFVEGIAPALNYVIDGFVNWAIETDAVGKAAKVLVEILKGLIEVANTTVLVFRAVGAALGGIGAIIYAIVTRDFKSIKGIWTAMAEEIDIAVEKYNASREALYGGQTPPGHPSTHTPVPEKKKTAPRFTDEEKEAEKLAKALKHIAEEALKSQEHLDSLFMKADSAATAFARKGLTGLELELAELDDAFNAFLRTMLEAWEAGAISTAEFAIRINEAKELTTKLKLERQRLFDAEIAANVEQQKHADWSAAMAAEMGEYGEATEMVALSLNDYNQAVSNAISVWGDADLAIRLLNTDLAVQNQKVRDAADTVGIWQVAWDYANTTTQGYMNQIADVTLNAFKSMEDAITKFVMTGKMNFKDFANQVIADLVRIAVRAAITAPLVKAIGGIWPALGGNANQAWMGGMTADFANKASGGPVLAGSSYIVGERGPELFVPSTSGTIVPGGGKGNVTVNIKNESGQPVAAKTSNASFDAQGWVIDVVLDGLNRNVRGIRTALGGA